MKIYLETERLILREFTDEDVDLVFQLHSDPEVTRFTSFGEPQSFEVLRDQVWPKLLSFYVHHNGFGYYAAIEKSTGEFIGWFHFNPSKSNPDEIELGYRLHKAAWGKGYATEGSRAIIKNGFEELGARRVVATALAANTASIRVMEKLGLKFEKTFFYDGIDQEAVKHTIDDRNCEYSNNY